MMAEFNRDIGPTLVLEGVVLSTESVRRLMAFVDAIAAAERERLAELAESRTDGWNSMTPEEIRSGKLRC